MKAIFSLLAVFSMLIFLLTACNISQGGNNEPESGVVATKVALTMAALTQSAQQTLTASHSTPSLSAPTMTQTSTQKPTETMELTSTQTNTLIPSETSKPSTTPIPLPGTILGSIFGYPYGSVPRLAIVAFGKEPPYYYSWIITSAGETSFEMSNEFLIPGHFQVVAYDSSGHAGGCTALVLVKSNQKVNCDISNWGGGYPPKPSTVPIP